MPRMTERKRNYSHDDAMSDLDSIKHDDPDYDSYYGDEADRLAAYIAALEESNAVLAGDRDIRDERIMSLEAENAAEREALNRLVKAATLIVEWDDDPDRGRDNRYGDYEFDNLRAVLADLKGAE